MQELIKITEQKGNRVVSARDLYEFLEVKTEFKDWMPRMLSYGFEEGLDFSSFLSETKKGSLRGRPSKDYALTIDTAKEIAMIQRTDKGKQARQYFIAMERVATSKAQIADNTPIAKIGNVKNESNELEKKEELLKIIKTYLIHGDIKLVSKDVSFSDTTVQTVLAGRLKNKIILKALYDRALYNKKNELSFLFNYQEMIDMLKE